MAKIQHITLNIFMRRKEWAQGGGSGLGTRRGTRRERRGRRRGRRKGLRGIFGRRLRRWGGELGSLRRWRRFWRRRLGFFSRVYNWMRMWKNFCWGWRIKKIMWRMITFTITMQLIVFNSMNSRKLNRNEATTK